ncbi:Kinetochore protein Nuf2 [Lemmus lemmus]
MLLEMDGSELLHLLNLSTLRWTKLQQSCRLRHPEGGDSHHGHFVPPRYSAAEIVVHIHSKLLTGADGKNFSKNDPHPTQSSVPVEEQEEFKQYMEDIQELQYLLNQFRQKTNELKLSMVSLKEAQDSLKSKIADSPKKVENCKEKMKDTVQKVQNSRMSALCRVLLSELPASTQIVLLGGVQRKGCSSRVTADPRQQLQLCTAGPRGSAGVFL